MCIYGEWVSYKSVDVVSEKHNQHHTTAAAATSAKKIIHNPKPTGTKPPGT